MLVVVNLWYYVAFYQKAMTFYHASFIGPFSFFLFLLYILPLPGRYTKYKWYMLRHCLSILFVPFYVVRFPDFFLGDQFTSHSQTILDLIHIVMNIAMRSFVNFHDAFASLSPSTLMAVHMVSLLLPQFIRMAQNLRRYHDTKDAYPSIYNGIKYFLSLVANSCVPFPILYCIAQSIYTIYALYWDVREDWGGSYLLFYPVGLFHDSDRNSKWFMLRPRTMIPHPVVYYIAIVLNATLRCAWMLRLFLVGFVNLIHCRCGVGIRT
ncbi:hypothetical protein WA556_004226 [Blastocystis sp. ATCC 50177/Nand II]